MALGTGADGALINEAEKYWTVPLPGGTPKCAKRLNCALGEYQSSVCKPYEPKIYLIYFTIYTLKW